MVIEWNDNLCIGYLEIDVQHRLLFDKFNSFLAAYEANGSSEEALRLFWFLEAYALTHFRDEEKLMLQIGFPDYISHCAKHQAFMGQVEALKERIRVDGLTKDLVSTMTTFITSWLVEHISTADRAISTFAGNSPFRV